MHSTRLIHLMMAALSVTAVTGVAWLDNQHAGAGQLAVRATDDLISIGPGLDADSTTDAPAADPTTSSDDAADDSTTSAPPAETTSDTPTTSNDPTPTPTTSDEPTPTPTTSNNPTPTTTGGTTVTTPPPNTTRTTPSSSAPTPSETSSDGNGGDDTTEVPQTTPPPTTSTFITVITSTDAAGQTHVSSSSSVIVSTPSPVADTSGENKQSGLSTQDRNTIIGVCVGVGGAIVLVAAGVLFRRLRNNKRSQEENEELVSYGDGFGGPGTAEKSEPSGSTAGRSPFQSTLESYHAPTHANAASNF